MADHNAPGQHHNTVYVAVKGDTPLYTADGNATGHVLLKDWLWYDDGLGWNGKLRLDNHEVITRQGKRFYFGRGGNGYGQRLDVRYGGIHIGDMAETPPAPVASGGGRGDPAPLTGEVLHLAIKWIPGEMYYKPFSPGSLWGTYGDPSNQWRPSFLLPYTYLLWSFLSAENTGGLMVRATIPDGAKIEVCAVSRVKLPSYTSDGVQNGWVWGQYVKTCGLFGWIVWAHEYSGLRIWHVV